MSTVSTRSDMRSLSGEAKAAIRERAVRAVIGGMSHREAARVFGVERAVVSKWMRRCWIRLHQPTPAGFVALQRLDGRTERRRVDRPEDPGPWAFPPFASTVTAGGRLLMAALERLLADDGGLFASANTDSATVLSTRDGGLVTCPGGPEQLDDGTTAVRAISWAALDAIRERFSSLGVELRLTSENFNGDKRRQLYAVGIAGSRVILYTVGPSGSAGR